MKSYYDDIFAAIQAAHYAGDNAKALFLIEEELRMPYIPLDFEKKLSALKKECEADRKLTNKQLSEEELEAYLKADSYRQLIAVNQLNEQNLRANLALVEQFLLRPDGNNNAKALLINSLISQEIQTEVKLFKDGLVYSFIPRYIEPIEYSDGYEAAMTLFTQVFVQNPALKKMAEELLINECFLYLPLSYDENEGILLADKIILYVYDCFALKAQRQDFIKEYLTDYEQQLLTGMELHV